MGTCTLDLKGMERNSAKDVCGECCEGEQILMQIKWCKEGVLKGNPFSLCMYHKMQQML